MHGQTFGTRPFSSLLWEALPNGTGFLACPKALFSRGFDTLVLHLGIRGFPGNIWA